MIILACLLVGVVSTGAGAYISLQKGRPAIEGAILGFVLGPFGVVAAAGLPDLRRCREDVETMAFGD
jgi:hypothetical protein